MFGMATSCCYLKVTHLLATFHLIADYPIPTLAPFVGAELDRRLDLREVSFPISVE